MRSQVASSLGTLRWCVMRPSRLRSDCSRVRAGTASRCFVVTGTWSGHCSGCGCRSGSGAGSPRGSGAGSCCGGAASSGRLASSCPSSRAFVVTTSAARRLATAASSSTMTGAAPETVRT
eukprot:Amastigsp_a183431_23.p3 type:complete len:120 gc:universal Amastigsp_a183431_23:404-763(+)